MANLSTQHIRKEKISIITTSFITTILTKTFVKNRICLISAEFYETFVRPIKNLSHTQKVIQNCQIDELLPFFQQKQGDFVPSISCGTYSKVRTVPIPTNIFSLSFAKSFASTTRTRSGFLPSFPYTLTLKSIPFTKVSNHNFVDLRSKNFIYKIFD